MKNTSFTTMGKKTTHLLSRNILSTAAVLTLMGAAAFAAAPTGGYTPGATLDPDCAPGDTDCIVQGGDITDDSWSMNGTNVVVENGNVGIGTDAPSSALEINGPSLPTLRIKSDVYNNSVSGGKIELQEAGGAGVSLGYDGTGGVDKFYIDTLEVPKAFVLMRGTGNVGIGTTSPNKKLHVIGDISASSIEHNTDQYNGEEITEDTANGLTKKVFFDIPAGTYNGPSNTGTGTYFKIAQIRTGGSYGTVHVDGYFYSGFHIGYEKKVNFEITSYSGSTPLLEPVIKYMKHGGDTSERLLVTKTPNADGNNSTYIDVYVLMGHVNEGYGEMNIKVNKLHTDSPSVLLWQKGENSGTGFPSGTILTPNKNYAFDTTGNVGIGTTSPSAKLHIESDETANIKLWSSGVDEDAYLQLGTLASGENFEFRLDESDERKLKIGPDSSNPEMTIQQNGYVGINTTNPLARLTIDASASDTTLFLKDGSQDIAFLEDQALQIGTINATGTGWTEQMRINGSNGNVGIGTTAPTSKLFVEGTTRINDGHLYVQGNGSIISKRSDFNDTTPRTHQTFQRGDGSGSNYQIRTYGDGANGVDKLTFWNGSNHLTMSSDGNVGIGTTTPTSKLDVNGAVTIGNSAIGSSNMGGCINPGEIAYNGTDFFGCSGSLWRKLNN